MKHTHIKIYRLLQFLLPSWLSGTCSVMVPLLFMGVIIAATRLHVLTVQYGGSLAPASATNGIAYRYATFTRWLDHNPLARNLPILIFWSVIGLVVYSWVLQIAKVLNNAVELEHELHYINSRPAVIVRETIERLLLRLVAVVALAVCIVYMVHHIIPRCIFAAHAVTLHATLYNTEQMLIALCWFIGSLLIETIFVRLLFLRVRLFGGVSY